MIARPSEQRHPLTALILLIAIALGTLVLFVTLAQFLGSLIYGIDITSAIQSGNASADVLRLFNSCYLFGMFLVPPLIYARIRSKAPLQYLQVKAINPWYLILITFLLMLFAQPFIEWTVHINQQLEFPAFLSGIENWMKYKEIEAEILTKQLLVMNSVPGLLINLFVIAVIPAISEELFFRGCLQKIFTTWTNNYHWGVWIAAALFSAIHLQFYGFLPRMLLGALFGYLFVYSKSIWIPIIAHFFNNASAVMAAYNLQRQGKSLDIITKPEFQQWYLVILSVIFTALLFRIFQKLSWGNKELSDER
ncbi:CPBP family intramembrane glutamic endopeptidase [Paradesertivirga mongoliensis]|uniref:CPBP family intramembrane glutamic endopeptidase n=1 Tax=Paradesertivirga mongoliensis TaxID=2100740 RepID=A0ABW4ZI26_9SPHI|nr:CPBP family intramembrane glutamic endopeptidase [Pedobacter mongoliensis]